MQTEYNVGLFETSCNPLCIYQGKPSSNVLFKCPKGSFSFGLQETENETGKDSFAVMYFAPIQMQITV